MGTKLALHIRSAQCCNRLSGMLSVKAFELTCTVAAKLEACQAEMTGLCCWLMSHTLPEQAESHGGQQATPDATAGKLEQLQQDQSTCNGQ